MYVCILLPQLLVGSEDFDIRVFKEDEIIAEMTETEVSSLKNGLSLINVFKLVVFRKLMSNVIHFNFDTIVKLLFFFSLFVVCNLPLPSPRIKIWLCTGKWHCWCL